MANYILLLQPSKATHKMLAFKPVIPLTFPPCSSSSLLPHPLCLLPHTSFLFGGKSTATNSQLPAGHILVAVSGNGSRSASFPPAECLSHALAPPPSLLLAFFIIYLQYFLIQNEAASHSELLMAGPYTNRGKWGKMLNGNGGYPFSLLAQQ